MSARVEIFRERLIYGIEGEEHWRERRGKWRWRYRAANGQIMAGPQEGYSRRLDCLNGCATVLGAVVTSDGDFLIRYAAAAGLEDIPVIDLTKAARPTPSGGTR